MLSTKDTSRNILSLPPEIMELIFDLLESVKYLQNCIQVCQSWRKIIFNKYKNKRFIRIISGEEINSFGTTEVIDLLDCKKNNVITEGKNHHHSLYVK